ncbi:hypothetical protein CY34DRAFT_814471 [Suillus luteus UH-Slu-Lm8-n1]|uniref:Uncharacterized protein n=1 Tax=Suillus luteus UH-Slu-Lm8-n1 TaxID=930992 RepID=A0A0D0ACD5_9AGAM|nr:hypothetical protein CY34DRAFT_814471 [Suillus luteus UH-Slu-Lm8-n1]
MASYSPLRMHDLEHQPEDSEDVIILTSKKANSEYRTADPLSKWPALAALAHSLLAIICDLHCTSSPLLVFPSGVMPMGCVSRTSFLVWNWLMTCVTSTKDVLSKCHGTGKQSLT